MDIDIGIAYATDLDHAERQYWRWPVTTVLDTPAPQFLIVSYGDSAITVRLRVHARYDDFFTLYWDLMRQLKPALDAASIEIPFPSVNINCCPEFS